MTNHSSQFTNGLRKSCLVILCAIIFSACSHGLEPLPAPAVQPGFSGTVYFVSPWPHPPVDSVYDIRVVAFPHDPPGDIIAEIESGQAQVYPPIIGGVPFPLFFDSLSYSFQLNSSATFQYVVVAMRDSSTILKSSSWKVVGVYGDSSDIGNRKSVVIPPNTFVNGINIYVNFKNPPPTPTAGSAAAAP